MSYRVSGEFEAMGSAAFMDVPAGFRAERDQLTSPEMLEIVRMMERGSCTFVAKHLSGVDKTSLQAEFAEIDDLGEGRQASFNGVIFGQMVLGSYYDHERPELVALKPFSHAKDVVHEMAVNSYVNRQTKFPQAFTPLGVWRRDEGDYNLITRYEHNVISYDSIFWADSEQEPTALTPATAEKAIRMSALGLGQLHGLGLAHGDSQVKNLGEDSEKIRFIDLESAKPFTRSHRDAPADPIAAMMAVNRDLDTLAYSALEVPDNRGLVAEVIGLQLDNIVKSYFRGVTRTRVEDSERYPTDAIPSKEEIQSIFKEAVAAAN